MFALRWLLQLLLTLLVLFMFTLGTQSQAAQKQDASADIFELPLEQLLEEPYVVSTASKYQQNISTAPCSVTIITADQIRKYGYRTLADILNSVVGFYISYDRNYHYLGVRGFRRPGDYDSRILVLLDGHRVNENIADSPPFGIDFPVDVDLINRIEIVRGPGFSLYGNNALLAVINVITKRGKDLSGLEVSGSLSSFETEKGRVTYGNAFSNGPEFLVSATSYDSKGQELYFKEFDDPATHNGLVRNDDGHFDNLFVKTSFGDFSLSAAYTPREKGIPTASWGTIFGDTRTRTNDDIAITGLTYNHNLSEKSSIKSRIVYSLYNYYGSYAYERESEGEEPPVVIINKERCTGRWWQGELQFTTEPSDRNILIGGVEFQYNIRQDQRNWDEEEVYLNDSRHNKNWGVYLQNEFKISNSLTFIGGVRYDRYDTFGDTTNPRLALIYNLCRNTVVKLLYGQGFRAPNANELYYNDGGYSQKASLNLEPETIRNYEVVLEQSINKNVHATISGFHYIIEDLIEQHTDPSDGLLVFKNFGKIKTSGLETALEGRWDKGLRTYCGYSYVDAKDDYTCHPLVNSPRHLAKLNLIVPVIEDRLFAAPGLRYSSKAKTLTDNYADDFLIMDLVLTYHNILKGLEISAGLYNLFDTEYGYPGSGEHIQDVIY